MQVLAFQVEQGIAGGPESAGIGPGKPAGPALWTMWESLAPLRAAGFVTAFVLCPVHPDWDYVTIPIFDTLARVVGANYLIDVGSSDVFALEQASYHAGYNYSNGIATSIQRVIDLTNRPGHAGKCLGFRFHEMWTTNWSIHAHPEWWGAMADRLPIQGDPFCKPELLYRFISLARGHGWRLVISEPHWDITVVAAVCDLADRYPGTICPCYANNLDGPNNGWWAKSIGQVTARTGNCREAWFSNQSWAYPGNSPDPAGYADRTAQALLNGITGVEFEASSALWNVPGYSYTTDSWEVWGPQHDGSPKPLLETLISVLSGIGSR